MLVVTVVTIKLARSGNSGTNYFVSSTGEKSHFVLWTFVIVGRKLLY